MICDAEANEIVGYATLNATKIERAFLPKSLQRNKPYPMPVTLLGQLAEAEPLMRRALAILEASLPDHHPWVQTVRENLSALRQ